MVIQRVMLIPYTEDRLNENLNSKSSLEKKLYKINTNIQSKLPSIPSYYIEQQNEAKEAISVDGKKKISQLEIPKNPIINEWINEMKSHLSETQLMSKKTFSLLNNILLIYGKDKKPWTQDFKLVVDGKTSHLASIIDLIKHLHVYNIKHTPIEVLDIYIGFLNTIGYPLTNVSSTLMKERMKEYFPKLNIAKKRKLSNETHSNWSTYG